MNKTYSIIYRLLAGFLCVFCALPPLIAQEEALPEIYYSYPRELKIADIVKDVELMATTRQAAIDILQKDKELESLEYLKLKTYLSSMKGNEVWSRIS